MSVTNKYIAGMKAAMKEVLVQLTNGDMVSVFIVSIELVKDHHT